MEFKFYCRVCGSKLSAEESMAGMALECPSCGSDIIIPSPGAAAGEAESSDAVPAASASAPKWDGAEDMPDDDFTPRLRPPLASRKPRNEGKRAGGGDMASPRPGSREGTPGANGGGEREESDIDPRDVPASVAAPGGERGNGKAKTVVSAIAAASLLLGGGALSFILFSSGSKTTAVHLEGKSVPENADVPAPARTAPSSAPAKAAPGNAIGELPEKEPEKMPGKRTGKDSETNLGKKLEKGKEDGGIHDFKIVERKSIEDSDSGVREVLFGEFVVDAKLYRNDTVKVYFSVPLGTDGKPAPSANNVIFHCPYTPERNFFSFPHHRWWSEKAGYTFFSMDINNSLRDIYDRKKCYYYPESGFHDLVFKCKRIIEDRYDLEHRKLLLSGESSGGVMAEEFVMSYFDRIDGVAVVGGHNNFVVNVSKKARKECHPGCLILHTCGDDFQRPVFDRYFQTLRLIVAPNWDRKTGKYFHHAGSPMAWKFIHLFLKGIVELRAKHGGKLPYYRDWPYSSARFHLKGWSSIFQIDKRDYFPSKEFKDAWDKIPNELLTRMHANYRRNWMSDERLKFMHMKRIRIRENLYFVPENPKAVVMYLHDPKEDKADSQANLSHCLYYLHQQGVVGASIMIYPEDQSRDSLKRVEKLLLEIKANKKWKDLPIYVCGLGIGGKIAALAALRYGDDIERKRVEIKRGKTRIVRTEIIRHPRVKKIYTINTDYSNKAFVKYLIKVRGGSKIPLTMIFGEDSARLKPSVAPPGAKIENAPYSGLTLGKGWFPILKRVANGD